jgi:hypothetical protein
MTSSQTYLRIVIPQVLRLVYYPITNQMVGADFSLYADRLEKRWAR